MTEVPVYEARTRLSELLARVQQGEAVTITLHGRPMARLVAAEPAGTVGAEGAGPSTAIQHIFEELAQLRAGIGLDVSLREAIASGRDLPPP